MGAEALSKVARRDLRRAFGPEASAEVLKFVDDTKAWLLDLVATEGRAQTKRHEDFKFDTARAIDAVSLRCPPPHTTFVQRLRWLVTGTWL